MTPTTCSRAPDRTDFYSRGWLLVITCAIAFAGCRSKQDDKPSGAPGGAARTVPAPAVTQASWAPDVLEELLAPIALYPDQLLGQILAASVNSQEVLDGGNWLVQNQKLKGAELDTAAQKAGFGPAMRALMQFPTVVDMMSQQIDWTRQLGSAFTSDQKAVLDAVQRLRAQAADVGNLKSTPQQTVERKTENGKAVVEVKPANPQVVYVPQYNPQVVYTTPPPAAPAPAATTSQNTVSSGTAVAAGLLAFGVGVLVGNASNDNDYAYPHWGTGAVYYGSRPFYPPAYVYRPAYSPAFRPAYRYAPPSGYRYGYNNNTNVVINNSNYYNRFTNNQNLRTGGTRSSLEATQQVAAQRRPGQPATATHTANASGQRTYAGAPTSTTAERRGAAAAPTRVQAPPTAKASTGDRGYGTSTRPSGGGAGTVDRQPTTAATSGAQGDHAFSGASGQGSGSFDRAASARGHASAAATREHGVRRSRPR